MASNEGSSHCSESRTAVGQVAYLVSEFSEMILIKSTSMRDTCRERFSRETDRRPWSSVMAYVRYVYRKHKIKAGLTPALLFHQVG